MICHIRPRTICSRFSITNWGLRFTTTQPIERADSMAKFRFSILWYIVAGVMLIASGEIGGTLPGTALLMSLLDYDNVYQRMIPSWTASKMFLEEMGRKCPMSLSPSRTELTWLEKAYFSESSTVWMVPCVRWVAAYIRIYFAINLLCWLIKDWIY